MKLKSHTKIVLTIIIILILTFVLYIVNEYIKSKTHIKEGFDFNDVMAGAKNFFEGGNNAEINKGIDDTANKAKDELEKAKAELEKVFTELVSKITAAFKPMLDFFRGLKARFANLKAGIDNINAGIKAESEAIGYMFEHGGKDVADILLDLNHVPPFIKSAFEMESANIGEAIKKSNDDLTSFFDSLKYIFNPYLVDNQDHDGLLDRAYKIFMMYTNCGIKRIKNFAPCFLYYMLNAIGAILNAILILFPIWIVKVTTGVDIACFFDMFFSAIDCLDDFWMGLTGYHLVHYSDYILDKCYYCDGIPHTSIYDNMNIANPTLPQFTTPAFPSQITDAINNLSIDYNAINGEIPTRLKYIGRFLGNDTGSIDADNNQWLYTQGIDPNIAGGYQNASGKLNTFQNDANKLVADFKTNIPNQFTGASHYFTDGSNEINAMFS